MTEYIAVVKLSISTVTSVTCYYKMSVRRVLRIIRESSTLWFAILVPLILLPLPLLHPNDVSRCAYCVLLIAIYWITEIIPLAVTSLLPVVLFPLWGVMSAKDTCSSYVKDTLMLFLGSLIVAVAVERWNLHKRLALRTLTLVGPEPKCIPREWRPEETEDKEFLVLAKSFSICTAYAANIGGMATLTGTPPNVIFSGQVDTLFGHYGLESGVNFANWLLIGIPVSAIIFVFCWGWLTFVMKGKTFPEVIVAINFLILVLLWVTRSPGFITGWGAGFKPKFVKDSTSAILISVLMFILPSKPPICTTSSDDYSLENNRGRENEKKFVYEPILNWKIVHEKVAWGVLLLMGGGFAIADGCQKSGFSQWISDGLIGLAALPEWTIAFLLSLIIACGTEVTSNAATATLFLPIVFSLAVQLEVHPLYFMVPCTMATSLAFLLPVATPPNAIAFSSGYLEVKDMVKTGIAMNLFSLLVVNLALNTWVVPLYDLHNLPDAFRNLTLSSNMSALSLSFSTLPPISTAPTV
ncbi:hypothetical protein LOTGIDRAFT_163443 [Lottia gigantea]|uniref:Citrate transporter-like domain-containing protein n=1 Tax=Lottia gigantea TaxID=225164 RepID=V4A4R7_LOTGI|nr:hypothetical protein LOTGIDRAFT_163443 [Lottia gigantea]ESO91712.1 hypothetical protein LOTGIDRAFT_163443 [Lottia gigantea]